MKALLQLEFIIVLALISLSIQQLQAQISREDAFEIINDELLTGNELVQASAEIVPAFTLVTTIGNNVEFSVQYDAWVFFIDDDPGANWAGEHPARYLLYRQ